MYALIGIVIGFVLNRLLIAPIERMKNREECVKRELVPKDWL